jgi:hypothetical protein
MFVGGKPEKEWWTVEPMLDTELRDLFRSRLLSQHRDGGIARNQFNEDGYQRYHGPHYQKQNGQSS